MIRKKSTIGSSISWAKKLLLTGCAAVLTAAPVFDAAAQPQMVQRWNNVNPGSAPASGGGIAFSRKSGNPRLYWVLNGTTGGSLRVFNANNGNAVAPTTLVWPTAAMNLAPNVPSGTYYARGLCSDADGFVYGVNYVASGASATHYILKWDPATSTNNPAVVWSGTLTGTSGTIGHNLAVYGTGNNAVFVVGTTSASATAGGFIVHHNGTSWVGRSWKYGATGPAVSAVQSGLSFIDYDSGTGIYRFYSKFSSTSGYINSFSLAGTGQITLTQTVTTGTASGNPLIFATSGALSLGYDPVTGLIALASRPSGTFTYTNMLAATTFGAGAGTNVLSPGFIHKVNGTATGSDGNNPGGAVWGDGAAFTSISAAGAGIFCYDVTAFKIADPVGATKNFGETATFSVKSGGSSLTYQWQKDGVNVSNGGKYSGATTATLTVAGVTADEAGAYTCVVNGVATSNWTSEPASLTVLEPVITAGPEDQVAPVGGSATFTVSALGTAPFSYQWKKGTEDLVDGADVSGATTATLTLSNLTFGDNGAQITVVVNSSGASASPVESTSATLTVRDPAITSQPDNQTVATGSTATFTVVAAGSDLTYQWKRASDDSDIASGTTSTLTLSNAQKADQGGYYCVVSGSGPDSPQTSETATLTVLDPAVITADPVSLTKVSGQSASFSVTASGDNLAYQWKRNGGDIANATSATLNIAAVKYEDIGSYTVVVSNSVSSDTSDAATLTVQFTLSVVVAGEPTVVGTASASPVKGAYDADEAVTLSATQLGNFTFASWTSGTFTNNSNPLVITMTNNLVVTANYNSSVAEIIVDNTDATFTGGWSTASAALDRFGADYRFANATNTPAASAKYVPTILTGGNYDVYEWHPAGANRSGQVPHTINHSGGSTTVSINQKVGGSWNLVATAKYFLPGTSGSVVITNNTGEVTGAPVVMADAIRFVYSKSQQDSGVTITDQPDNATTTVGGSASFTVAATGTGPLSYSWTKDGNPVADGGSVSGAATPTLTITGASLADVGSYVAIVTNIAGAVSSDAATLTLDPVITSQPVSLVRNVGEPASFTVGVYSSQTVSYQWKLNGDDISGATDATYSIVGVTHGHAGNYTVTITSSLGSDTSVSASLTVFTPPSNVAISPTGFVQRSQGAALTITATADGTAPLAYQWFKDGGAIGGATDSTLSFAALALTDDGFYKVAVSNGGGITLESAEVEVDVVPDTTAPVLKVVSPKANGIYSNTPSLLLSGTALDAVGIASVQYSHTSSYSTNLNVAATVAFFANGKASNYTANITLDPGTNTYVVVAKDLAGNAHTLTVKAFYHTGSPYTLVQTLNGGDPGTNHVGSIIQNTIPLAMQAGASNLLYVGRTYTLKVKETGLPKYVLTNWTATWEGQSEPVIIQTNNTICMFTMRSNMNIKANYIDNPFYRFGGAYNGLFSDEDNGVNFETAGFAQLKVTDKQILSGKLFIDGDAVGFSGKLKIDGTGTIVTKARTKATDKPELTINVTLDFLNGTETLSGTITDGTFTSELLAHRAVWTTNVGGVLAESFTNSYTFLLPGFTNENEGPVGSSYQMVTVDRLGKVKGSGHSADGHVMKSATVISKEGNWPYFSPQYKQPRTNELLKRIVETRGFVMGWLNFTTNVHGHGKMTPTGELHWIKKDWTNTTYAVGFTNAADIVSSRWVAPVPKSGDRALNMIDMNLAFSEGGLGANAFDATYFVSTNTALVVIKGATPAETLANYPLTVKASLAAKTGLIKGTFIHPDLPPLAKPTLWYGVMLQEQNLGAGFFMGPNLGGKVTATAETLETPIP